MEVLVHNAEYETSYGKSSLIELKNTDNFMDSTIEHIFEGNVRRGKAGGYHYECIKDTAGNMVLCQDLVQVKMRNFSPF